MIPVLDPDPEYDFQPFGDSGSGFGSGKKWNRNTSLAPSLSFPVGVNAEDLTGIMMRRTLLLSLAIASVSAAVSSANPGGKSMKIGLPGKLILC